MKPMSVGRLKKAFRNSRGPVLTGRVIKPWGWDERSGIESRSIPSSKGSGDKTQPARLGMLKGNEESEELCVLPQKRRRVGWRGASGAGSMLRWRANGARGQLGTGRLSAQVPEDPKTLQGPGNRGREGRGKANVPSRVLREDL